MSNVFSALQAASSGAQLGSAWLDVISNNVANLDTVRPAGQEPFRAMKVQAAAAPDGTGVRVTGYTVDNSAPDRSYDPGNPLADSSGYVTHPVVNLADEMTSMLIAQRLYAANLQVSSQVTASYRSALQIGH